MKAMDSSSLRIGAWHVDPALGQISKDGYTVKLERRAMQLLLCLAEHAGQVVSVEELLDQVWAGVVVTSDSVYHAVAALRRTLGDDSHDPTYIANVPRRGYRLVAAVTPSIDAMSWSGAESQAPAVESHAVTVVNSKSIAVLPFADMSERKDQEYFADGMAEGIRDLLAKIPAIRVIGRASSCQFKGNDEDLRAIGSKLGVAYVLEGSVRRSGNQVRVTARLIDVSDGSHRWSGSYDRDLIDVLKVQDEISVGLVRALQVTMGADDPRRRATLKSIDGYSLYLQGRQSYDRYDKQGFDQAASYFRRTLELDPESALALAWLALVSFLQAAYGYVDPGTGYEEARRFAERARMLDPRSELAVAALGLIHLFYDWEWTAAAAELDRALALAPGSARILHYHSLASSAIGQWDASIRELNASLALDPLYPATYNSLGRTQLRSKRWSEAEAAFRRTLEGAPNYALARFYLATTLLLRGHKEAALKQIDLESIEEARWAGRAAINHALGREADSAGALRRLTELGSANRAYLIACVHAYRGESDAAFLWLERAFTQRDGRLSGIKGDPFLRALEEDPRYKAFLRKMKLPVRDDVTD